jgi:uncharacterized membrane protein YraQ (UPF0718 family)
MQQNSLWNLVKRWWILAAALLLALGVWLLDASRGAKMIDVTLYSFKEMLLVLPPIFIILGLLDVWVPREKMVRYMGEGSGAKGLLIALFLGSAAAGPLYGAFPVAQVLLKKGASIRNVLILIGAWSTTKIPMLMFEYANMGARFTLTRLVVDLVGILLISVILERLIRPRDREEILAKANAA